MKKTSVIIFALAMFTGLSGVSLAVDPILINPIVKPKVELKAEAIKAFQEARCAKIQEKIAAKTAGFDENKDRHYEAYKNLKDRLDALVAKLSDKGYDVTNLKAEVTVMGAKIQKFADDYAAYQAKLGETKDFACGHSDGDFKAKLAEARTLLKTVREDSRDIKNYYLNTIKPELKEIRKQKVATE